MPTVPQHAARGITALDDGVGTLILRDSQFLMVSSSAQGAILRLPTGINSWEGQTIDGWVGANGFTLSGATSINGATTLAIPANYYFSAMKGIGSLWVVELVNALGSSGGGAQPATVLDDFNRADENLEANPNYIRVDGVAGALAVRSNQLAGLINTRTRYVMGSVGVPDVRMTALFTNWTDAFVMLRYVDVDNYIMAMRFDPQSAFRVMSRVAGVQATLANFQNVNSTTEVILSLIGDQITYSRGGVASGPISGSATIPSNVMAACNGTKVGIDQLKVVNPFIDYIKFEGI